MVRPIFQSFQDTGRHYQRQEPYRLRNLDVEAQLLTRPVIGLLHHEDMNPDSISRGFLRKKSSRSPRLLSEWAILSMQERTRKDRFKTLARTETSRQRRLLQETRRNR